MRNERTIEVSGVRVSISVQTTTFARHSQLSEPEAMDHLIQGLGFWLRAWMIANDADKTHVQSPSVQEPGLPKGDQPDHGPRVLPPVVQPASSGPDRARAAFDRCTRELGESFKELSRKLEGFAETLEAAARADAESRATRVRDSERPDIASDSLPGDAGLVSPRPISRYGA